MSLEGFSLRLQKSGWNVHAFEYVSSRTDIMIIQTCWYAQTKILQIMLKSVCFIIYHFFLSKVIQMTYSINQYENKDKKKNQLKYGSYNVLDFKQTV